jgi:hypothetical protein
MGRRAPTAASLLLPRALRESEGILERQPVLQNQSSSGRFAEHRRAAPHCGRTNVCYPPRGSGASASGWISANVAAKSRQKHAGKWRVLPHPFPYQTRRNSRARSEKTTPKPQVAFEGFCSKSSTSSPGCPQRGEIEACRAATYNRDAHNCHLPKCDAPGRPGRNSGFDLRVADVSRGALVIMGVPSVIAASATPLSSRRPSRPKALGGIYTITPRMIWLGSYLTGTWLVWLVDVYTLPVSTKADLMCTSHRELRAGRWIGADVDCRSDARSCRSIADRGFAKRLASDDTPCRDAMSRALAGHGVCAWIAASSGAAPITECSLATKQLRNAAPPWPMQRPER